ELNAYIIKYKHDLDSLAYYINNGIINTYKYYKLVNNLDSIPFTSVIGTSTHPFKGNFNGKNKTILVDINLISKDTVGLFGFLDNASISNLSIRGTIKGNNYVGGICGIINTQVIIDNCSNYTTILGNNYVGGICGYNYKGTIKNCINDSNIFGDNYIGGICGYHISSGSISDCINKDIVSGEDYVGGICGFNQGPSLNNINLGVIKTETYYIGGICGYDNGSPIELCHNTQNICMTIDSGTIYIGGICGKNTGPGTNISKCINIGNLGISGGMAYIGGICGENNTNGFIINTFNAGNIRDGNGYFGGIAGINNHGIIINNINVGYINSTSFAYGAISSTNSGTFMYNYYDKQMCIVKGINDTDIIIDNGAVGLFTFELTNGNLPDFFNGFYDPVPVDIIFWNNSYGLYPYLNIIGANNNDYISKVSASPIFLDTTSNYINNVDSISRDFKVSTQNSVSWQALRGNQILDINSPNVDLIQTGVDTLVVSLGPYSRNIRVVVIPPFTPEFKIYPNPDTVGAIVTNIDTSFNVYCNAKGFVNDYGKIYYELYKNDTLVSNVDQFGSLYLHLHNDYLGDTTIKVDSNGYIPFTDAIQLRLIDSNFTGTFIKTTANWHTDGEYLLIFKLLQVDSGSVSGGIMSGGNVIDTLDTDTIRMLIKTLPELIHIPDVDSIATDINYNYRLFLHANGYYHDSGRIYYRLYHQDTLITNVSFYGNMIMDNIPLINGQAYVYPANVLIGNLDTSVKKWIPLNVNWKDTGTYTLIFDLYQYINTFPFMVLTSDTIQMRVVYKLLPDLTVSPVLDTGMTDYDYYFGLNLHAHEYLKDSGRIQYSIYYNDTLVSVLSNYGNFQFANASLTYNPGFIFSQTFLMGDKDSSVIDSIPLLFNWLDTGNYRIVFELFQYENDYPFASLVLDTIEIFIVKRILPVLTHQPNVDSLTKNITYNYGLILHANDYNIDSGCIHYQILYNNNIIDTLSNYGNISIDSISLTNSTGTVPPSITYIENLDSMIKGEIPIVVNWSDTGNYTLIFDLYSYKNGDTVKVLARDTIIMHVGNRKLPILTHTPEVDSITKDITYQ
ncbi:MAG TPA: hypothetical protein PKX15_06935, partial [Bacteroidales bacterium]|nr:hypothetical protein [Bacteroidales bacterium]